MDQGIAGKVGQAEPSSDLPGGRGLRSTALFTHLPRPVCEAPVTPDITQSKLKRRRKKSRLLFVYDRGSLFPKIPLRSACGIFGSPGVLHKAITGRAIVRFFAVFQLQKITVPNNRNG